MANLVLMRSRRARSLVTLVLLVTLAPSGAAAPMAKAARAAAREIIVSAEWLQPTSNPNRYKLFDAYVLQHEDLVTGEIVRRGEITEGTCRVHPQPSGRNEYACVSSGPRVTTDDHFEVAEDGSRAELRVLRGEKEWTVEWVATDEIADLYSSDPGCGPTRTGAGISWVASTTAVFRGKKLRDDWHELAPLVRSGASVGYCDARSRGRLQQQRFGGPALASSNPGLAGKVYVLRP